MTTPTFDTKATRPENEAALLEVVKAARAIQPLLSAVQYQVGFGRTQKERVEALRTAIDNLDRLTP